MINNDISVIIPLYNKEREIEATLRSVLGQTVLPGEVIVVDDGSTDDGADVVRAVGSPLVRIITQPNSGVSAARNRGAQEAVGQYVALLDGDDTWEPGFVGKISEMIAAYPGCGVYATGFSTVRGGRKFPVPSPTEEGVLDDYFCHAVRSYVCSSSSVAISRELFLREGGFPEGMKIGEDQWFWIQLASQTSVCFTPEPLANYMVTASNRSASIYTPEKTTHSFEEFYRPADGNSCRNEYIARCAINKAIALSAKGDTEFGRAAARFYAYTSTQRRALRKLRMLNRLPRAVRPAALAVYNRLAWLLARKGL